ncbi:MAG: PBP1A family penicillin-binding protein [Clostridia bacterium]|nr:PBP1A family penicillin-binding protein [Clostridia bacterium]
MKLTKKQLFVRISLILFLLLLAAIISFGIYVHFNIDKEIDLSLIRTGSSSITKIYYFNYDSRTNRTGEAIELKDEALFLQRSEWKSIYDMPNNLKNAFIAIEDKRFYKHKGVDWLRTIKAAGNYIFGFDKRSFGGSTITQQLIKNLTGDNNASPKRKLEEIFRAINLEKDLSKNEILESYLNVVYLSENCYGVGSASELYFGKNVKDLSLKECVSLASIVQNPTKYDPYTNTENNDKRSKIILNQMLEQGMITQEEYERALNETLVINSNIENEKSTGIYSWFTEALISDLIKDISIKYDIPEKSAKMMLLKGGLNIYSTIDPKIQYIANDVCENYKSYILPNDDGSYPEASCVVIDANTSDVLAIVGGLGEKSGNRIFNRATQAKRAPGSVLKPLSIYAPAIENNLINYSTVYDDVPIKMLNGSLWPKNSPNKYRGLMPISYAVEHSTNTVAVKVLENLGINNSYDFLTKNFKLNLDSKNDLSPSPLALGQLTNGETLLNITNAYTAFANGGYISKPKTYLYVTDNFGNIVLENKDSYEKILDKDTAVIMNKLLEGVINNGTARYISLKNKTSVAGKTGTSSDLRDRWFIGYTPSYVCGAWCGYDTPKPMYYTKNPSCILFDEIMNRVYDDKEHEDFYVSDNIVELEFCIDSGKLPCEECKNDMRGSRVSIGYFKKGTEPTEHCNLHKKVVIDIQDGLIADALTPSYRRRAVSLLDYTRNNEFNDITILDSEYFIETRKRNMN